MTWEEVVSLLISTGSNVHVVRAEGADAVSLQLPPAGWFVSLKETGALNLGIYEGDDNRLVGTRTMPLEEVTPEFLRAEVDEVQAKQIAAFCAQQFCSPSTDPPEPPIRW